MSYIESIISMLHSVAITSSLKVFVDMFFIKHRSKLAADCAQLIAYDREMDKLYAEYVK